MEIKVCSECGKGPLGQKAQQKMLCKSCSIKKTLRDNAEEIQAKKRATCLAKYGVEHQMKSSLIAKKVAETTINNWGGIGFASKELREKVYIVCEKKYNNKNFKNKEKQNATKIKRYGNQNFNNREKAISTSLIKYGTPNPMQNKDIQQKAKNTCVELYGTENPFQSEQIKSQIKETKIEKYGTANGFSAIQKAIQEKHGVDNIAKLPKVKEKLSQANIKNREVRIRKTKENCLNKYGVDHPSKRLEVIEKMSNTALKRTPEEWLAIAQKRNFKQRSTVDGLRSESSWEAAFIKHHPGCERGPVLEYFWNGKAHRWIVDFEWNGNLYEVKNPFYFDLNYPKWNPEKSWEKWKAHKLSWYLWSPMASKPENTSIEKWFAAEELLAKTIYKNESLLKEVISNSKKIKNIIERFLN